MSMFDDIKKKASDFAEDNPDKLEKFSDVAIEKGGDAADTVTHDKYADKIDGFQEKADDAIGDK